MSNRLDEVRQLERNWKADVGSQEREYYVGAQRIAAELADGNQATANAAALELLGNLVSKRAESREVRDADFDVGAVDLVATATVTRFLLANDSVSMEQRHQKVRLLANVLGAFRAEAVPAYAPKRVVSNVAQPAGVPGAAGMDPEAIADPVAREKYKAAIRENQLNNLMNQRQQALQGMEGELAKPIVEYMSRVAAIDGTAASIVRRAVVDARLTDAEKAQVMRSAAR